MNQGYAYKVITKLAGMEEDTDLLYKNHEERVLILQQGKIFFSKMPIIMHVAFCFIFDNANRLGLLYRVRRKYIPKYSS